MNTFNTLLIPAYCETNLPMTGASTSASLALASAAQKEKRLVLFRKRLYSRLVFCLSEQPI